MNKHRRHIPCESKKLSSISTSRDRTNGVETTGKKFQNTSGSKRVWMWREKTTTRATAELETDGWWSVLPCVLRTPSRATRIVGRVCRIVSTVCFVLPTRALADCYKRCYRNGQPNARAGYDNEVPSLFTTTHAFCLSANVACTSDVVEARRRTRHVLCNYCVARSPATVMCIQSSHVAQRTVPGRGKRLLQTRPSTFREQSTRPDIDIAQPSIARAFNRNARVRRPIDCCPTSITYENSISVAFIVPVDPRLSRNGIALERLWSTVLGLLRRRPSSDYVTA